ncbi:hypothetical protein RRF57_009619 [Xylaria bambusicola]|uniref:VWFA domain-containing protein n=1 Tax=Xylaria bambusicola TaxID=326684 RepID=A0AAN7Z1U6_9PEZI
MSVSESAEASATGLPTTSTVVDEQPQKANIDGQLFRDASVSFAVDISGSTYGATLAAETAFIKNVSNLLSPRARFDCSILPWDDTAHPSLSLAQLHKLEDRGGTNPGAILENASHKATLKASSVWFLMTDGLIPSETRIKFAHDIAKHGVHSISCVVVVFGNPSIGPSSCDISVGVSLFAAVPNCAFLFCNETNDDLRAMQTKGVFNVLLKGQPPPVFDSSSSWDSLPQVCVADFAAISIPTPKHLDANEVALQDSLVINMDDLFANCLSADQVASIFADGNNLDSVRMTMQARGQQDDFRHWLRKQAISPDDPLFKPRRDLSGKAGSLFIEVFDLVSRGQLPPASLQLRLRTAYRENMRHFIAEAQDQIRKAEERKTIIKDAETSCATPIHLSPAISPSYIRVRPSTASAPQLILPECPPMSSGCLGTPLGQVVRVPSMPPRAPYKITKQTTKSATMYRQNQKHRHREESWGSWITKATDVSLRGLLYSPGLRSTKGSFRGTCPLCGANDMTLSWVFRAASSSPSPTGANTEGFPLPRSHTRLAFPLAMGHFKETSSVLASLFPASTPRLLGPSPQIPSLVCDPCSVFYTNNGALSFGITTALPLVSFFENREAVCGALMTAFEGRFAESDLPQVFLSVLMFAAERSVGTPRPLETPAHSRIEFDIPATMAAAAAATTFRAAVDWTVRDILHSVVALRELSESFSLPSNSPAPVWPLATVLAGSFEELDSSCDNNGRSLAAPLLRYPLPGFVTIVRAVSLLNVDVESRRRAVFRRLLHLVCEELDKMADQAPYSQSVAQVFSGLLGRPLSTKLNTDRDRSEWEPTVSISIQNLRHTSLLGPASYGMMCRAEEFRHLEDPLTAWVPPAIALFLHTLFMVVTTKPRMGASETFQTVTNTKLVGNALYRPEGVNEDDVRGLVSLLQDIA